MKSVNTANLPVGSYIDQPVYLDEKYILLSPDIPITKDLTNRLEEWDFKKVFTNGQPSSTPVETTVVTEDDGEPGAAVSSAPLENDVKEQGMQSEAGTFFLKMTDYLSEVFELYLRKNEFSMNRISEEVKNAINFMKTHRKQLLRLNDLNDPDHSYLISHSVKTMFVSLVMTDVLKLPPFKQIETGMAAMLHEIGMLRIPPQLYMSSKVLSDQERKAIAAHTVLGFRILKAAGFPMTITRAVLEHHERVDGSGYPRGLTGDKISLNAKIIAIAGSYAAILSKRPYRDASDGHTGIMDLLKNTGKIYDEQLIRILVYTLSIYPVGTYVALSNGTQGVVVETDPENPRLPIVKLYVTEKGTAFRDHPVLHTQDGGGIHVLRPLVKKEIQHISKLFSTT